MGILQPKLFGNGTDSCLNLPLPTVSLGEAGTEEGSVCAGYSLKWAIEKGITASGQEITISKTQRQKMLGNGIVPQEIEDICNKLKDFLVPSYLDSQLDPRSGLSRTRFASHGTALHTSLDSQKPGFS